MAKLAFLFLAFCFLQASLSAAPPKERRYEQLIQQWLDRWRPLMQNNNAPRKPRSVHAFSFNQNNPWGSFAPSFSQFQSTPQGFPAQLNSPPGQVSGFPQPAGFGQPLGPVQNHGPSLKHHQDHGPAANNFKSAALTNPSPFGQPLGATPNHGLKHQHDHGPAANNLKSSAMTNPSPFGQPLSAAPSHGPGMKQHQDHGPAANHIKSSPNPSPFGAQQSNHGIQPKSLHSHGHSPSPSSNFESLRTAAPPSGFGNQGSSFSNFDSLRTAAPPSGFGNQANFDNHRMAGSPAGHPGGFGPSANFGPSHSSSHGRSPSPGSMGGSSANFGASNANFPGGFAFENQNQQVMSLTSSVANANTRLM